MDKNELYDFLQEKVGVTSQALDLAFSLCGFDSDTAEKILFYFTGYDDFEEYKKDFNLCD